MDEALGATQTAEAGVAVAVAAEVACAFGATHEALAGVAVAVTEEDAEAFGATQFAVAGVAVAVALDVAEAEGATQFATAGVAVEVRLVAWTGMRSSSDETTSKSGFPGERARPRAITLARRFMRYSGIRNTST